MAGISSLDHVAERRIEGIINRVVRKSVINTFNNVFKTVYAVDHIREVTANEGEFEIKGLRVYLLGEELTGVRRVCIDPDDIGCWYIDRHTGVKTNDVYIERLKVRISNE